jgi:site-specific recombinase XerD
VVEDDDPMDDPDDVILEFLIAPLQTCPAPCTLHEARHCYASYTIAAGVNLKALSTFMGHARIAITLDLYGHLLPG